jgi:hypothetical protein
MSSLSTLHPACADYKLNNDRPEILPLRLRQRGASMATASNWIFNYTMVQITPRKWLVQVPDISNMEIKNPLQRGMVY